MGAVVLRMKGRDRMVVDIRAQDIKKLEAKQLEVQQAADRLDKLQEELLKQVCTTSPTFSKERPGFRGTTLS